MNILVTGVGGFVGYHVARRLLEDGHHVVGFDNMSSYYDVTLKQARLAQLKSEFGFDARIADVADAAAMKPIFAEAKAEIVIHLAAQAGVRYSLTHPEAYAQSNLVGFTHILEACRSLPPRHLLYASSSSVYGANRSLPFRESDHTDQPVSFYAATKRANEAMAHSYAHLFRIPATGLRFFTVFGEWGRPDMAFFSFSEAILSGRPITLFNHGKMARDFTYVGDVAEAVEKLMHKPPAAEAGMAPHRVVNIASGRRLALVDFVSALERAFGREAVKTFADMQAGDVVETWGDISLLKEITGFTPQISVDVGVKRFAQWYEAYRLARQ
jgi:UDP-glucuronate 4-epimerase